MKIYNYFLLIGLSVAGISYLIILFGKSNTKQKVLWTIIVISGIFLQRITEPMLIHKSFSIFIHHNRTMLEQLNAIVSRQNRELFWGKDSILVSKNFISEADRIKFQKKIEATNILLIHKDHSRIFYVTFGSLDTHGGVFYFYDSVKPDSRFKHIVGNWYY